MPTPTKKVMSRAEFFASMSDDVIADLAMSSPQTQPLSPIGSGPTEPPPLRRSNRAEFLTQYRNYFEEVPEPVLMQYDDGTWCQGEYEEQESDTEFVDETGIHPDEIDVIVFYPDVVIDNDKENKVDN